MDADVHLFSFIPPRTLEHGMVLPTFRVDFVSGNTLIYMPRGACLFWVTLNPVTVTIMINCHRSFFQFQHIPQDSLWLN